MAITLAFAVPGFGTQFSALCEKGRSRNPTQVDGLLSPLRVVMPALSLGGVESLVCVPSRTSHRKLNPEQRARAGISDGLIRVSVGIEGIEDLLEDVERALEGD